MKILNKPRATYEQCEAWLEGKPNVHPLAKAMLPLLWDSAIVNGIDPTILIAQAMKETGYFNFKGVIRPNYCNTCGLKITKGGGDQEPGAHMRFEYWEDGIMAHSDHLALYAGASNQPKYSPECGSHLNENCKKNGTTKDPRHFTYLHGKCPNVEDLGGNWAPSSTYGTDLVSMVNDIINTKVNKVDVKELQMANESLKEENSVLREENRVLNVAVNSLNVSVNKYTELFTNIKVIVEKIREIIK